MTSIYTPEERGKFMKDWPRGARRPSSYVEFFEWAEAQGGHGLTQKRCPNCQRYNFPQERNALDTCASGCEPQARPQVSEAKKELPSWGKKAKKMARLASNNESVFRKLGKSYRRHYKKSHGLRG